MKFVTNTPQAFIVTATKSLVDDLLAMNTSNRKLRQTAVERLKRDIEEGDWKLTASGVGVDRRGVLSDGQHRLVAIKQAGYPPVEFTLVIGLDPSAQAAVDRHAKRSLADALSLVQGRTISTALIAACNYLLAIKNATSRTEPFVYSGKQPSDGATAANLLLWEDDLNAILGVSGSTLRAPITAALAVYHRHDREGALLLAEQIKRGIGLDEYDPGYRLRSWMNSNAHKGGVQNAIKTFSITVTAIIAHAESRKLKLLKASDSWVNAPWRKWEA